MAVAGTQLLRRLGLFTLFARELIADLVRPPWRPHLIWQQCYTVGNQSLMIIILTGAATGGVFGLQIGGIFKFFSAEGFIGGATGLALVKELAPLITGFVLAGKAGSAMAAELSTMVAGEQVDALEAMGLDPVHYLAVPRVWASVVMMPLLCTVFIFVGMIGVYGIGIGVFGVSQGLFFAKIGDLIRPFDLIYGLFKMTVFALTMATIACYRGLHPLKGAVGVGLATTGAVVQMLISLLSLDLVLSYLQIKWLEG